MTIKLMKDQKNHRHVASFLRRSALLSVLVIGVLATMLSFPVIASAAISVTPSTWNVIGLDSNSPATGPNLFPVGAKVCGGTPGTSTSAYFTWDRTNPYIDLRVGSGGHPAGSPLSITYGPDGCTDAFFEVEITKTSDAFTTPTNLPARYHITVAGVSTPTPRELIIERLVSQARNAITNIEFGTSLATLTSVPAGGSFNLTVGNSYYIRMSGYTATQGYEQLESFVNFPNTIFQVLSVSSTYSADTSPIVNSPSQKLYADACGWDSNPTSPTYLSCSISGKAGGTLQVTYYVKILEVSGSQQKLSSLIHDFSGSSFHYNADYSTTARFANIINPASVTIAKSFSPNPTSFGGVSALTLTLTNPNYGAISGVSIADTFPCETCTPIAPGDMTLADNITSNTCGGTLTDAGPGANGTLQTGDKGIQLSNATLPANGSCTVKVNVTTSSTGTYSNLTDNIFVSGLDIGNFASATLTVDNSPPPGAGICGDPMATWTFPGPFDAATALAPPPTTSNVGSATARAGGGINPVFGTGRTDIGAWGSNGGISTSSTLATGDDDYFEFALNTTGYISIDLSFYATRTNNGPRGVAVYHSNQSDNNSPEPNAALYSSATVLSGTGWFPFGSYTIPVTAATTYIRIYGYAANNNNPSSNLHIDDVVFTGCKTPTKATIEKIFSPTTIASGSTSTLTFTLRNPNATQLTGARFTDTLPTGMTVAATPAFSTTCGGSPTWGPTAGATSLTFGSPTGGTIPPGSCTVQVDVTTPTAGSRENTSGFLVTTEAGTNQNSIASATLVTLAPPVIAKEFAPNPILAGGVSTLTFTITNPNGSSPLSGVAVSDTLPAGLLVSTGKPLTQPDTVAVTNGSTLVIGTGTAFLSEFAAGDRIFIAGTGYTVAAVSSNSQLTLTSPYTGATATGRAISASTSGCSFSSAPVLALGGNPITLGSASIAPGGTCTVRVNVTAAAAGSYPNTTGNVSHILNTVTRNGNTASATLTVTPVNPAISLLKQVGPSSAGPWSSYLAVATASPVHYHLTVENIGDVPLSSVNVTDPTLLAAGINPASCVWRDGDGLLLTAPFALPVADADDGHIARCTLGPLTAIAGTHPNTATATGTYGVTPYTDTATAIYATTALSLNKSADRTYFLAAGDVINYSYAISNAGANLNGPLTFTVTDNRISTVTCPTLATIGNLDYNFDTGETLICSASYTVDPSDVTNKQVVNLARANITDGSLINFYTPTDTVTVPLGPNLSVTKSNNVGGNAATDTPFGWTLTASNAATSGMAATFSNGQTLLQDDLPADATYSAPAVPTNSGGTTGTSSCSIAANVLTCTATSAVSIPPGGSFSIVVTTTPTTAGSLANPNVSGICRVDPSTVVTETNESDNDCANTVTVTTPAVTLVKTANKSYFLAAGEAISYTYTIKNTGASILRPLPATPVVITVADNKVTVICPAVSTIGDLDIDFDTNEELTCTSVPAYTVLAADVTDKQVTNTATATVTGPGPPVLSPQVSLTVPLGTDLSVTKLVDNPAPVAGSTITYTLNTTNNGPNASDGILVSDILPAGVTYVSDTGGGAYNLGTGTWTVGTLASGQSAQLIITLTVNVGTAGQTITNTASLLASTQPDIDAGNNSASVNIMPTQSGNLSTSTKTVVDLNGGDVLSGDTLRYTITLINTDTVAASNVRVTDNIPANVNSFVPGSVTFPVGATNSSTGAGTGSNVNGFLDITGITILASSSVTIVFEVLVNGPNGAIIANTANINNPDGIGGTAVAPTLVIAAGSVPASGTKQLYLQAPGSVSKSLSRTPYKIYANPFFDLINRSTPPVTWNLTPVLQTALTLNANTPVILQLASDDGGIRNIELTLSYDPGTGPVILAQSYFIGLTTSTAVPTTTTFNMATPAVTIPIGSTLQLTINNDVLTTGASPIYIFPYYLATNNTSRVVLNSATVINVDSIGFFADAAYVGGETPLTTVAPGTTVRIRSTVSDPFGSYDITAATVTITDPLGVVTVNQAAMTQVFDSAAATKVYEYRYTIPAGGPTGNWDVRVDAKEGTEIPGVNDYGLTVLSVVNPPNLTVVKMANKAAAAPGETITYTITLTNSGPGIATSVVLDDRLGQFSTLAMDTFGSGNPFNFTDGATPSGYAAVGTLTYSQDNGVDGYSYVPPATGSDPTITNWKMTMPTPMNGNGASFTIQYVQSVR